jgi:hypothetical protein
MGVSAAISRAENEVNPVNYDITSQIRVGQSGGMEFLDKKEST